MNKYDQMLELIKQKGLKKSYIAEKLGITPTTFWKKHSGQAKFTKAELYMINAILTGEYEPIDHFVWEDKDL